LAARSIKSAIAGVVVEIQKRPGDTVTADETVITLECMKMEIPVAAPVKGRILSINVQEGDTVPEDHLMFVLET
jgi:acetyl-CoA carboxylase biotin carboxyl carrier protein